MDRRRREGINDLGINDFEMEEPAAAPIRCRGGLTHVSLTAIVAA